MRTRSCAVHLQYIRLPVRDRTSNKIHKSCYKLYNIKAQISNKYISGSFYEKCKYQYELQAHSQQVSQFFFHMAGHPHNLWEKIITRERNIFPRHLQLLKLFFGELLSDWVELILRDLFNALRISLTRCWLEKRFVLIMVMAVMEYINTYLFETV